MAKVYHYTYALKRVKDGKLYIGVRSSRCPPEEDVSYMSSSKSIRDDLRAGVRFRKQIIATWSSRKKAVKHEVELHEKYDVARNPKFLNKVKQTTSGFDRSGTEPWNKDLKGSQEAWNKGIPATEEMRKAQSIRQKGRRHREESKLKIASAWTPEKRREQSRKNSGANNPRFGCRHSDATRARMSAAWTDDVRAAKSEWARENSPSKNPDVAARISAKLKGVPKPRFTHPDIPGVDKPKANWSAWARKNVSPKRFETFMNQLIRK